MVASSLVIAAQSQLEGTDCEGLYYIGDCNDITDYTHCEDYYSSLYDDDYYVHCVRQNDDYYCSSVDCEWIGNDQGNGYEVPEFGSSALIAIMAIVVIGGFVLVRKK